MSLTRTKYGIEYDTRREENDGSSAVGWIIVLVVIVAAISFIVHVAKRISSDEPSGEDALAAQQATLVVAPPPQSAPAAADPAAPAQPPPKPIVVDRMDARSREVKNLLLRLKTARDNDNVPMQVEAIESLRALPGDQAADFEDDLVRELGELNVRRLYALKNPQWVSDVTVKKGDTATGIASAHKTTLAAIKRLNPDVDLNRIRPGMKLAVMDSPALNLVVRKKLGAVDLNLNGKLFKRYQIEEGAPEIAWEPGIYESPANLRDYLARNGVELDADDAREMDELVPRGTKIHVSPY
ncbi:MAG: LysM peptidoglycan-binding domain-containing protein [Kiritimatiellae bacterium]|nr:LysM peptidoglycan-binding domain-containing protein [Kiritimatiellia bacterium]